MRSLLLGAALMVLPGIAMAQSCCNIIGTSSCCVTNLGCVACEGAPSFSTKHTWKITAPGALKLGGTAFTITFNDVDFTYALKWKDKALASGDLTAMQRKGVALASDRQDAGLPLE